MLERRFRLDASRKDRVGLDEAIYCAGKSVGQLDGILAELYGRESPALLTRLDPALLAELPERWQSSLDYDEESRTAWLGEVATPVGPTRCAVVTAGTTDAPVAREASRTLRYYGETALEVFDVGVAGLWRLLERLEEIRPMRVVIAVAGMEASLPSVIGGQVAGAVIAVPTSTGYGVAAGGETALRAALASCAPGLVTVNIDNGYGAACAALRILRGRAASAPRSGSTSAERIRPRSLLFRRSRRARAESAAPRARAPRRHTSHRCRRG